MSDRARGSHEPFLCQGDWVAPSLIEAALLEHPAVVEAAVVGVADGDGGQVPLAFVVVREPVGASALLNFAACRLAPQHRIRRLTFVDALPRGPDGALQRDALRAL